MIKQLVPLTGGSIMQPNSTANPNIMTYSRTGNDALVHHQTYHPNGDRGDISAPGGIINLMTDKTWLSSVRLLRGGYRWQAPRLCALRW